MMPEQQQRILGYFIEEAKDHLNTIEQGLLNLQATIQDPEMVSEVFRAAHSVKGGAAMLSLGSIQQTSHRLEDYFKILKETPTTQIDRDLESMFLQVFDALQALLEELQGPFGLTEDKAQEVMADVEPVFERLEIHLNELVAVAPAVAEVAPKVAATAGTQAARSVASSSEDSALKLVFSSDVPGHLREMLTLFKRSDTAASRAALQNCCDALKRIGEQFDLSLWCELVAATRQAVGNPEQTYRSLAPVVIKELKRAQEQVLSGQANAIAIVAELESLLPLPVEADEAIGDIDSLLDDALSTTEEPDLAELFESETQAIAVDETDFDLLDLSGDEDADINDDDFSAAFTKLSDTPSATVETSREPTVGAAELNSLADLFEGEVSELDSPWEEISDKEAAIADNPSPDIDLADDFSDLLDESLDDDNTSDTRDDLADLFGDTLEADDAATADSSAEADSNLRELFDLPDAGMQSSDTDDDDDDLDVLLDSIIPGDDSDDVADGVTNAAALDSPDSEDSFDLDFDESSLDAAEALDSELGEVAVKDPEADDFEGLFDADSTALAADIDETDGESVLETFEAAEALPTTASSDASFEAIADPWSPENAEDDISDDSALDALDELWTGEKPPHRDTDAATADFSDFAELDLDTDSESAPAAELSPPAIDELSAADDDHSDDEFGGLFDDDNTASDNVLTSLLDDAEADTALSDAFATADTSSDTAVAATEPGLEGLLADAEGSDEIVVDDTDDDFGDLFGDDLDNTTATEDADLLDLSDDDTHESDALFATAADAGADLEVDAEPGEGLFDEESAAAPAVDDMADLFDAAADETEELDLISTDSVTSDEAPVAREEESANADDFDALLTSSDDASEPLASLSDDSLDAGNISDLDLTFADDADEALALDAQNDEFMSFLDDAESPTEPELSEVNDGLLEAAAPADAATTSEQTADDFFATDASPELDTTVPIAVENDIDDFFEAALGPDSAVADDELDDFPSVDLTSSAFDEVNADALDLDLSADAFADDSPESTPTEDNDAPEENLFDADFDLDEGSPSEAALDFDEETQEDSSTSSPDSLFDDLDTGDAALDADDLFEDSLSDEATDTSSEAEDEGGLDFDLNEGSPSEAALDFNEEAQEDSSASSPDSLFDDLGIGDAALDADDLFEDSFSDEITDTSSEAEDEGDFLAAAGSVSDDEGDLNLDANASDLEGVAIAETDTSDRDLNFDTEAAAFDDLDDLLTDSTATVDAVSSADAAESESADFDELDDLLGDSESFDTGSGGADFDELDDLLADDDSSDMTAGAAVDTGDVDFDELDALIDDEEPIAASKVVNSRDRYGADDDFGDLEKLLEEADQTLGGTSSTIRSSGPGRSTRRVGGIVDQTMRVSVKHLDNLNNLVGELVVNRNSLEQDQDRFRQFLDNLLFQVQQLNDVGQRMRDLYERSLLESSLLASRQAFQTGGTIRALNNSNGGNGDSHATGASFDALEMDRFTGFHTLTQEMIELIVRVRESSSDIAYTVESTDQIARQFRQVTTQLQEGLNKARMVPFAQTADRLPRAVRDISIKCGKEARLIVEGRDTLIDKMLLERLYDPMTHLVNNAITHGIEPPEERAAIGKPREGKITVRAFYQGNQTVIYIEDDGAGINPDVVKSKAIQKGLITKAEADAMSTLETYELLFRHGFSTRDQADDFAGRGVGMDVVRTALSEIRGAINIDSEMGKGTSFTIRLPLTLSISKALSCLNNQARIAFPMDGVEDMFDVPRERVQVDEDGRTYIQWRDTSLTFQPLSDLLHFNRALGRGRVYGGSQDDDMVSIVVLRNANTYIGIQVDRVLGEQEIVIKQIEGPVPKPMGIAGATVLGDGRVMPIGDVLELIDIAQGRVRREAGSSLWSQVELPPQDEEPIKVEPTVLIVDDSITVRELLSMSFNKVGYRVEQARDGQEAWEKMRSGLPCDLVFCDIEMPRMDGLELLSRMQKDSALSQIPIAMLTSRGADRHRQMAVDLGASGYFTKPYLEEALLEAAQRMLKGEVLLTQTAVEVEE